MKKNQVKLIATILFLMIAISIFVGIQYYRSIPLVISAEYTDENLLKSYNKYLSYSEAENLDFAVNILITTNVRVTHCQFVKLDTFFDEDTYSFKIAEILYEADKLTAKLPLNITTVIDGSIPTKGIVLKDNAGTIRCFTIVQSGLDGSIVLLEESMANNSTNQTK